MRRALGDVKTALRKAAHVVGDDRSRLRGALVTYLQSGRDYNRLGVCVSHNIPGSACAGGAMPMDMGAFQWQKCGKSKGKEKGHHKGKGKTDEGESWKGKSKDHGKGKPGGKGKSPPGTVVTNLVPPM